MPRIEDGIYILRMTAATILFPLTFVHWFTTICPYEIPETSMYYPPWKRRENQKRREQEKLDAVKKTYAYRYSMGMLIQAPRSA